MTPRALFGKPTMVEVLGNGITLETFVRPSGHTTYALFNRDELIASGWNRTELITAQGLMAAGATTDTAMRAVIKRSRAAR